MPLKRKMNQLARWRDGTVVGPESTHPNLVWIATGPAFSHGIMPVVSSQYRSHPLSTSIYNGELLLNCLDQWGARIAPDIRRPVVW